MQSPAVSAGASPRKTLGVAGGTHLVHDGFSDSIYVLLPLWAQSFGLSHAEVGLLKGLYSAALASFQIPAGLLAERFGERWPLVLGTLGAGGAFLALGWSTGFASLAALLAAAGLASGTQHPLGSALVARAYPTGRRGALGIYNFSGDLGKVCLPAAVALLIAHAGWREATFAAGGLGLLAGAALALSMIRLGLGRDLCPGPRPGAGADHADGCRPAALTTAGRAVSRGGWGIEDRTGFGALSAIAVADSAVRTGFLTFLPFLLLDRGAEVASVGFALALVFAGGAAGKLLCGLVADRLGVIRTVVATELATAAGVAVLVVLPLESIYLLLPLVGLVLNGTSSVLYGTVSEFVRADRQARAFGLFYTVGIAAGALAPPGFGLLSDRVGLDPTVIAIAALACLTLPPCYWLAARVAQIHQVDQVDRTER